MLQKFKNFASKNWITSLIGVLIIVLQIGQCILNGGTLVSCISLNWEALLAAVALLFARDFTGDSQPKIKEKETPQ